MNPNLQSQRTKLNELSGKIIGLDEKKTRMSVARIDFRGRRASILRPARAKLIVNDNGDLQIRLTAAFVFCFHELFLGGLKWLA